MRSFELSHFHWNENHYYNEFSNCATLSSSWRCMQTPSWIPSQIVFAPKTNSILNSAYYSTLCNFNCHIIPGNTSNSWTYSSKKSLQLLQSHFPSWRYSGILSMITSYSCYSTLLSHSSSSSSSAYWFFLLFLTFQWFSLKFLSYISFIQRCNVNGGLL